MTPSGNIRDQLKSPYSDGTTHVIFEPLDFIAMRKQLEQDIGRAIPLQESLGGFSAVSTPVVQRALP